MARALIIAVGVLMTVVLAAWYFGSPISSVNTPSFASTTADAVGKESSQNPAVSKTNTTSKKVPTTATKSLLTQKGSYQCDFTQVTSTGQSANVIYLYGGKLRAEFRTRNANGVVANLLVYDGHYVYEWREGASTGKRSILTSLSDLPLVIPKDLTSGQIFGDNFESVGWLCHTWLTNKSLLTPPSYVTFN